MVKAGEAGVGASVLGVATTRNVFGAVRITGDEAAADEGVGSGGKAAEASVADLSVDEGDSPVLDATDFPTWVLTAIDFFSGILVAGVVCAC
jgi:hypothetical protein